MKMLHSILKVLLSIILLMPVLGVIGVFPEPTADLYNNEASFAFIKALSDAGYIMFLVAITDVLAVIALWTRREALGALLALPVTVNVIGFHFWLDGGLFTPGAIMANAMLLLNLYFLWKNKVQYSQLLQTKQ